LIQQQKTRLDIILGVIVFSLSSLNIMLVVDFHKLLLPYRGSSFYLVFWVLLSWKTFEICQMFPWIEWENHVIKTFLLMHITLMDSHMLNHHCVSRINPLVMVCNHFNMLLDLDC
jgi:hypothetical protein